MRDLVKIICLRHGNISRDLSFDMDSTRVTNCIYLTEKQAERWEVLTLAEFDLKNFI